VTVAEMATAGEGLVHSQIYPSLSQTQVEIQKDLQVLYDLSCSWVPVTWSLTADEELAGIRLQRDDVNSGGVETLHGDGSYLPPDTRRFVDLNADAGTTYRYTLIVTTIDGDDYHSAPVTVATGADPRRPDPVTHPGRLSGRLGRAQRARRPGSIRRLSLQIDGGREVYGRQETRPLEVIWKRLESTSFL
jgi:hypothetical protein